MNTAKLVSAGCSTRRITDARLVNGIDTRLSDSPSGDFLSVFSSGSTWNTNLWGGGGYDLRSQLTCVAWTNDASELGNPVALTKRHCIVSEHAGNTTNSHLTFTTIAGDAVSRQITNAVTFVGPGSNALLNFRVLLLDSDLPDSIGICPLFSGALYGRLSTKDLPYLQVNQFNRACVSQIESNEPLQTVLDVEPTTALLQMYYEAIGGGDSGSPAFYVLGDTLVYATHITTTAGGPNPMAWMTQIEAAIHTLNSSYAATLIQ